MTTTTVFTRAQYMSREVTLQEYYAQFVSDNTLRHVRSWFTPEVLRKALAKDEHLNTIPLSKWDTLAIRELEAKPWDRNPSGRFQAAMPYNGDAIKAAGETVTRAVLVCIAKTAARMIADTEE